MQTNKRSPYTHHPANVNSGHVTLCERAGARANIASRIELHSVNCPDCKRAQQAGRALEG